MDTTDGELETSLGRTRLRLDVVATADLSRLGFSSFSRHLFEWWLKVVTVKVVVGGGGGKKGR